MTQTPVLLAYVPVLHQGYIEWWQRFPDVSALYLIGKDLVPDYRPLAKDLRALAPEMMKPVIASTGRFATVEVVTPALLATWRQDHQPVIAPDEDVTREVVAEYLDPDQLQWDSVFLRWEAIRTTVPHELEPDVTISHNEFDRRIMATARAEAEHSSDWWRQVGAALVVDGELKMAVRNRHLPQDMQHYSDGDPRALFQSGVLIELTSSIHAEAELIAQAAKQGIRTAGGSVYATTFPCPVCAKLLTRAGITKIFYTDGYSLLDGEAILKSAGVEIVKVA